MRGLNCQIETGIADDAYVAEDEKELAVKNYQSALEMDPNTDGVKGALAKLR